MSTTKCKIRKGIKKGKNIEKIMQITHVMYLKPLKWIQKKNKKNKEKILQGPGSEIKILISIVEKSKQIWYSPNWYLSIILFLKTVLYVF